MIGDFTVMYLSLSSALGFSASGAAGAGAGGDQLGHHLAGVYREAKAVAGEAHRKEAGNKCPRVR